MWHQIIPLLISLSVFFSCEDAPVEEVLIEEQLECKPLIVNDTLFNNILAGNNYGAIPLILYESIPASWHLVDNPAVRFVRYKNGCFHFPIDVSHYTVDSARMVWSGKMRGDTATLICQLFGKERHYPDNRRPALLQLLLDPFNIEEITLNGNIDSCVVKVLYWNEGFYQPDVWKERIVKVNFN